MEAVGNPRNRAGGDMRIEIETTAEGSSVEIECECGQRQKVQVWHSPGLLPDPAELDGPDPIAGPSVDRSVALAQVLDLRPSEAQILECLALGATDREIAEELESPLTTVRAGVRRLVHRLGVRNRTE